ncbi:TonB-dependent receptor [Candidatus Poribacteria bacterium]|nr:TonB-dependent receptor [Candidatus Poribacteria bacterium]
MKKFVSIVFLLLYVAMMFIILPASADEESRQKVVELDEIAVTATRVEKDPFNTPNSVSVLNIRQLERTNADISSNLLRDVGGVIAQQTTVGQGSPMLRSLTGYHTLVQVDWVRLNNSTFRSGPNQYTATISPENLDRAEVLLGSNSMLYGSGAMGGVISFFSKTIPINLNQKTWRIHPRILGRYSTATQERLGRVEISGSKGKLGLRFGGGFRQYGDLNSGNGYDLHYKNRKFEIVDEIPSNVNLYNYTDIGKLSKDDIPDRWTVDLEGPLGWKAYDSDVKITYHINTNSHINIAYQMWRQPQTPRYDKIAPQEFDEFFFEPQNRDLLYANYISSPDVNIIDFIRLTASFQRQKEGRNEVKLDSTSRRQRYDTVNTIGLSIQAISSVLPQQRIVGGAEFYLDTLQSHTINTDLNSETEEINDKIGRFIDGSQFWDTSIYIQDEIKLHERIELTLGGRTTLYQTKADLSIRDSSFDEFNEFDSSLTGSAGIVVGLTDTVNLVGSIGTAFRAPSLNDTTAVEVTNEGVTAPSPDLDAETSWTVEGGLKSKTPYFHGTITIFHSKINGLVTRRPVQDAYPAGQIPKLHQDLIEGYEGIDVLVFDNVDEAQFQGIELTGITPITPSWSIYGNAAILRGKVLLINGESPDPEKPWEERTRREPPLNGIIGIQFEPQNTLYWGTLFVRAAAEQRRLNRSDIRDPRIQGKTRDPEDIEFDSKGYAIDAGTPGWWTINLRGGVTVYVNTQLTLSVDNILDKRYRQHGSGVNAPGFNISVSLDNRF